MVCGRPSLLSRSCGSGMLIGRHTVRCRSVVSHSTAPLPWLAACVAQPRSPYDAVALVQPSLRASSAFRPGELAIV